MSRIYQTQFTSIVRIDPKKKDSLKELLEKIGKTVTDDEFNEFSRIRTLHFCRAFQIDKAKDFDGNDSDDLHDVPPRLVFSLVFDGDLDDFLAYLFAEIGESIIDPLFSHCIGYPSEGRFSAKIQFLKEHRNEEKLFWPAKRGATVEMIKSESRLKDFIQGYLDKRFQEEDISQIPPRTLYDDIKAEIAMRPAYLWALTPEPSATLGYKIKSTLWAATVILIIIILAIPILVIWIPLTALFNKRDKPSNLPLKDLSEVLNMEDRFFQNQLTIYATIKAPRWFRIANLKLFLFFAKQSMRYRATKGSLSGITSIHFVSWSIFNKDHNGMFLSNYDNGWQSYLSEFIDKGASIMNLSFGNLLGYPKIIGWRKGGAHDEQAFKGVVRQFQYRCPVWYTAYPTISVSNVLYNSKIRQGLSKDMSDSELKDWFQLF